MRHKKIILYSFFSIILILYMLIKSFDIHEGNDINVYLNAAKQLLNHKNIYLPDPLYNYFNSPLFALILSPLSLINWSMSRLIWNALNIIIAIRMWVIFRKLSGGSLFLTRKYVICWSIAILIMSLGYLNLNLSLGQVTIFILWLTVEGLLLILSNKNLKGAMLIALGINIKLLPLIVLFYLFFKAKYKAITYIIIFTILSLILPGFIIGVKYNFQLHKEWKNTIDPAHKYVFEYDNGNQAINALLPAFFNDQEYKMEYSKSINMVSPREIIHLPYQLLLSMMQIIRFMLLLSIIPIIFFKIKERTTKNAYLYFYWELGYLMLISLLIFPHQSNYSMLYFVPTGVYIVFYYLFIFNHKLKLTLKEKITGSFALISLLICSFRGRDLIGNYLVDLIDYYHFPGINNIIFLIILIIDNPYQLVQKCKKLNETNDKIDCTQTTLLPP